MSKPDPAVRSPMPAERGLAALVDVETTGFSPVRDEVVELAVLLFGFDRATGELLGVVDEYTGLQEPSRPIPAAATAVNGITDAEACGHVLDHPRALGLLTQAEFLIAHNAAFDRAFLMRMYPPLGRKPWLCSLKDIDWRRRALASHRLHYLLVAHGLRSDTAHRALADCHSTLELLAYRGPDGSTYFQEMVRRRRILSGGDAISAGSQLG